MSEPYLNLEQLDETTREVLRWLILDGLLMEAAQVVIPESDDIRTAFAVLHNYIDDELEARDDAAPAVVQRWLETSLDDEEQGIRVTRALFYFGTHTVPCALCDRDVPTRTAHAHGNRYVGDECCWTEQLRGSE